MSKPAWGGSDHKGFACWRFDTSSEARNGEIQGISVEFCTFADGCIAQIWFSTGNFTQSCAEWL